MTLDYYPFGLKQKGLQAGGLCDSGGKMLALRGERPGGVRGEGNVPERILPGSKERRRWIGCQQVQSKRALCIPEDAVVKPHRGAGTGGCRRVWFC